MCGVLRSALLCLTVIVTILAASTCPVDLRLVADVAAGDAHLEDREFGAAITHYLSASRRPSQDARVLLRLAQAYLGQQRWTEALDVLGRIPDRDPDLTVEKRALIGRAWHVGQEQDDAIFWWRMALRLDPYNRMARLGAAQILDSENRQGEAASRLRMLLLHNPDDGEAAHRLGLILLDIRPKAAIEALREAAGAGQEPWAEQANRLLDLLSDNPQHAEGAAALGLALLEADELLAALRQFELAISREPDFAVAHAYRGHIQARLGRPASEAFRLALALEPNLVMGHYFLGRYHQSQDLPELARAEFEKALALDPDNPALGIDIALTYADEGNYVAAEGWLDAAIERAPLDAALTLAQARFYIERRYRLEERGLPALDAALMLAPDSAEGHDLRGWALYLLGRRAEAMPEFTLAIQLDPALAAPHAHLGMSLLAAGQIEAAHWELNRAIDLDAGGPSGSLAAELLD